MKLRLRQSTVRLRLEPAEVEALAAGGRVVESLQIPGVGAAGWSYGVRAVEALETAAVAVDAGGLEISLPQTDVVRWAASEAIEWVVQIEGLTVSLERELGCDHRTSERSPSSIKKGSGDEA